MNSSFMLVFPPGGCYTRINSSLYTGLSSREGGILSSFSYWLIFSSSSILASSLILFSSSGNIRPAGPSDHPLRFGLIAGISGITRFCRSSCNRAFRFGARASRLRFQLSILSRLSSSYTIISYCASSYAFPFSINSSSFSYAI